MLVSSRTSIVSNFGLWIVQWFNNYFGMLFRGKLLLVCHKTISDAHQYGCSVVSWSPEIQKKRFASGGWDNVVKIWSYDAGNWVNVAQLKGNSGWIRSVAWAKGSTRPMLASCSQDRTVIVWTKISGTNWTSQKLPIYFNGLSTMIWHRSCARCFYNCRRDPFPKVAPFFPDLAGQFFL